MIFYVYSVVKKVLTDMQCKVSLSKDSLVTRCAFPPLSSVESEKIKWVQRNLICAGTNVFILRCQ